MAKVEEVVITDDFDGTPATQSFTYTWLGTTYEIDLNKGNSEEFRTIMDDYASHSRKVTLKKGLVEKTTPTLRKRTKNKEAALIRAWGVDQGVLEPSSRGRIPQSVIDGYRKSKKG